MFLLCFKIMKNIKQDPHVAGLAHEPADHCIHVLVLLNIPHQNLDLSQEPASMA